MTEGELDKRIDLRSSAGHLSKETATLRCLLRRRLRSSSGRSTAVLLGRRSRGSGAGASRGARNGSATTGGALTRHLEELIW